MNNGHEGAINYIKKIKGKTEIIRSAHARIGEKYGFISKLIKIVLLIGSTISTTLIFTKNFNEQIYVLIAGVFSLILFILSLLELVLNYEKNAETHNQVVKLFTSLIRDLNRAEEMKMIDEKSLGTLQNRYDWINESSPWIPDKDFLEAKRWFRIKKGINKALNDEMNFGKSIKLLENEILRSDDRK